MTLQEKLRRLRKGLLPGRPENGKVEKNAQAKIGGNVVREIVHKPTGQVVDTEVSHNMVVIDGRKYMRDVTAGRDGRDIDHVAVGDDGTDTTETMSSLQGTESIRKQISAGDITKKSDNTNEYFLRVASTEPGSQPVDMAEVGLFTAQQGDPEDLMFSRATFSSFTKTQEFEVRFYYATAFKDINQ